jgi:hypothetical protein
MQRSKKGRPRNVIAQGNAKLAFTGISVFLNRVSYKEA